MGIRSEELNPPMKPPLITINDEQWAAPKDIDNSQKNLARVEPSPSFLDNLESRTSTTDGGEADSTFGSLYSDKVFYSDCKPSEPVEVLNIMSINPLYYRMMLTILYWEFPQLRLEIFFVLV